jgi:hypothetical protein
MQNSLVNGKCTVKHPEERKNGACLSKREDVVYLSIYTTESGSAIIMWFGDAGVTCVSTPAEVGVHVPAKRCGQACGSAVVNGKTYIRPAISWQTRRPITARSATTIIVLLISYPMVQQDVDIANDGGTGKYRRRLQTRR